MKQYRFKYTKRRETLIILSSTIAAFCLTLFLGLYNNLNYLFTIVAGSGLALLVFQTFKRKAVHTCTAKLGDISVIFEFENRVRTINFTDLVSYKFYCDKNGQILSLKSNTDNCRIIANNNFCKTDDFKMFCNDIIAQLNKYRDLYNSELTHEGSIYATRGFLYFWCIAALLYLAAFFFETSRVRVAIGIAGGYFLLIMLMKYFIENKKNKM